MIEIHYFSYFSYFYAETVPMEWIQFPTADSDEVVPTCPIPAPFYWDGFGFAAGGTTHPPFVASFPVYPTPHTTKKAALQSGACISGVLATPCKWWSKRS